MEPHRAFENPALDHFHGEAKRAFSEALEQPSEQRAAWVERMCGPGSELCREVMSLLENYDPASAFFERPAAAGIAPAPDPMVGRRIGVNKILRQIGMGGMGAVYLAERADDQFRKRVAIKTVRPGLIDEHVLRRFQNERQMLAVLDHPSIVKLLDAGTTEEGVPYLVMEYVEGQPIDVWCTSRRLSVPERVALFRTVVGAVHFAHQNLVVHRDLKPSNILVTPDGVPKLLDFGIAKLLRAEFLPHMGLTRTELQPMTPEFASPEQMLGQPINTASDIYSLGVILYRLLTGCHPYNLKTHTALELHRAICETEPERPSRLAANAEAPARADASLLRGDLDTIVLMAMRKEPQRRYASAEHFSEDLRRHLEGFPVLARKAGGWYRLSKFAGRHKAACIAAVVAAVALSVSGLTALEEKRAAERRFEDLRQFANYMLNDLDGQMRRDTMEARRALASKSLNYLDGLAREKSNPAIQRDLVNGYIKNGDVQGNLFGGSLGKTAIAEGSYRKALRFAEDLARSVPDPENQRYLALAHLKLGEVLNSTGNRTEALKHFAEASRVNRSVWVSGSTDLEALKDWFRVWSAVASAESLMSDFAGARESYQHVLEIAQAFPATYSSRPVAIVLARENLAYWGALAGDSAGAEATVGESIRALRQIVSISPSQPLRRHLAKCLKDLADLQRRAGKLDEAIESARQSTAASANLLGQEPGNKQYQIDLQQVLLMEIALLNAGGLEREARLETVRALHLMKPLADSPDAPFQHAADYAELLSTTPFSDLRDDPAALHYARKALQMTREMDAEVWHVMALAYARNGEPQRALEAERKVQALTPSPPQRAEHK